MIQLRSVLKPINIAVKTVAAILVVASLLFSGYAIWDNSQVYASAKNVMIDIQNAKPTDDGNGGLDFRELLKINPDVKLWLTLDGTEIDAPVVQGKDNYYYLNHDVFCKSSLAGSLFLDSRNAPDFSDIYNVIYGHHMKGNLMFGDLDLYLEKNFFDKNTTGTFLLPDNTKKFETVAVMKVFDSTKEIFKPSVYTDDLSGLCTFIENNAIHISADVLAKLKAAPDSYQVTALVTCTDGSTGTRLVLFVMTEYDKPDGPVNPDDPDNPDNPDKPDKPNPPKTGYDDHLIRWLSVLAVSGIIFAVSALWLKKRFRTSAQRKKL